MVATLSQPAPESSAGLPSTHADPRLADIAGVLGLTAFAFAVRWPNLRSVPRFTDEVLEVLHALRIARGGSLPLTNYDSYDGALLNYIWAAVFVIFGHSPWSPRVVSCIAGALTVGLTYLLVRDIATDVKCPRPRLAGILASLMMAMCGVHIVVNSHIAWSNSTTPLFTTLGLWLVVRLVQQRAEWLLLPVGLVFGLALQTHPLAGVFIPAAAAYALLKARWLLRSPWLYAGVLLFVVGYSNVIVHNVVNWGDSLDHAQFRRTRDNYLVGGPLPESDAAAYARNIVRTAGLVGETAVSSLTSAGRWPVLADRLIVMAGLGAVVGSGIWLARAHQPLPLLGMISAGVLIPLANPGRYEPITDGRYVTPLLPLGFGALAVLVFTLPLSLRARMVAVSMAVVVFVLQPIVPLARYSMQVQAESPSNEALARSVALIMEHRQPNDPVLIDNRLNLGAANIPSPRFARAAFDGLTYLFPFYDVRPVVTQVSRGIIEGRLARHPRLFVVQPPGYRSELMVGRVTRIRSPSAPEPMDPAAEDRPIYNIYLVERLPEGGGQ